MSKSGLTMTGGTVTGNTAHGEGGGVSTATERAVRITDVTFSGNEAGVPAEFEAGEGGGGALSSGGDGVVEIVDSTFEDNSAPGEGGAIYLDNNGSVAITDSVVRDNQSGAGGGGIENAATRVTFTRLLITGNRATLDGGGVESQGSGAFTILDSSFIGNTAENGGGFANGADGSTRIERSLFWDNRAIVGLNDDTGLGGGVYGLGDADASYENVTITGNFAQVRGGGFYVDSDAGSPRLELHDRRQQLPARQRRRRRDRLDQLPDPAEHLGHLPQHHRRRQPARPELQLRHRFRGRQPAGRLVVPLHRLEGPHRRRPRSRRRRRQRRGHDDDGDPG